MRWLWLWLWWWWWWWWWYAYVIHLNLYIYIYIYYILYIYNYIITTLLKGGTYPNCKTQFRRFWGRGAWGGPGKCQQAFIFLTAFYLQDFILVGPLTLYGISFIFLKNTGGHSKCPIAFLKKTCKKMKHTCKIVVWRSANSCRIAENQKCKLKVCRSPIAWYVQYILHFFMHLFYLVFYHFHM